MFNYFGDDVIIENDFGTDKKNQDSKNQVYVKGTES